MDKVEKFYEVCNKIKSLETSFEYNINSIWELVENSLITLHSSPSKINALYAMEYLQISCLTLLKEITTNKESLLNKMCKTYETKNHDYGDSFGKSVRKYGFISCVTRMSDKVNRYESLSGRENSAKVNESLNDTLLDLLCYSVMTIIEIEEIYN